MMVAAFRKKASGKLMAKKQQFEVQKGHLIERTSNLKI